MTKLIKPMMLTALSLSCLLSSAAYAQSTPPTSSPTQPISPPIFDPLAYSLQQLREQILRDLQISLIKDLELKEPRTIAVLPFTPIGTASPEIGQLLTEEMNVQLYGQGFWKLIERSQLDKLIKEQGFSQSALADQDKTLELGKLLGADAILIGSYAQINSTIRLNVRLIHVAEGTVLAAASTVLNQTILGP